MILLSRLIKSGWSNTGKEEGKVITIRHFPPKVRKEETEKLEEMEVPVVPQVNIEEIILQAKMEAEQIINEAKNYETEVKHQLEQAKEQWEIEKLHLMDLAKEEGFKEGFEEGKQQGYGEYKDLITKANKVIQSSKEDYFKKIESSEQTILMLALKVAEKIMGQQLKDEPERFIKVVKNAIQEAKENREVQLHVHPKYYDFILSHKEELIKIFPREVELYIYPNEQLSENGCVIESESGRIDASVDVQLEEIKRKLFDLLESE